MKNWFAGLPHVETINIFRLILETVTVDHVSDCIYRLILETVTVDHVSDCIYRLILETVTVDHVSDCILVTSLIINIWDYFQEMC